MEEKRLELRLAWERSGAICPECGTSMNRHDLSPERKWRHLDSMGFETILLARIPRANCPEHGVSQMKVPWAEKHSRFTLAFEAFAIKVLQASRSVAAAQGLLRLNWESIHTIMERAVQRGVDRRSWEGVEMVGMDEKSFLRGQSYASVLYDLTPGQARVLEVMDGHDGGMLELPLHPRLPEEAGAGDGIGGQLGQKRLDRHVTPKPLVVKEAYLAHAAPSEDLAATETAGEGSVSE